MYKGFIKVAAAVPRVNVADCQKNINAIESLMARAEGMGVEVICFPELSITGYTCGDLLQQQLLIEEAEVALLKLLEFSHALNITAIVGVPLFHDGLLYDCAAVIKKGKIYGFVPKTNLSNYGGKSEKRWFSTPNPCYAKECRFCGQSVPFGSKLIFSVGHYTFGIELGEDLLAAISPGSELALHGAEIIFNPASYGDSTGKDIYVNHQLMAQSGRCICGYVMASSGYGESTSDMVFGGNALIAENGNLLAEGQRFSMNEQLVVSEVDIQALKADRLKTQFGAGLENERYRIVEIDDMDLQTVEMQALTRVVTPLPFVPEGEELDRRCEEILCIQSEGLARRIEHTSSSNVVLGISGGLDSTLALLVCVNAFDRLKMSRKGIVGVTMPGFGTTSRTYNNAVHLMQQLGITIREISIKESCRQHFSDIGHDGKKHDVTYENAQARERTQILMDIANQVGGIVVGTGDMSELALGWATYNGDHMSMYGVNASVPKTLIKHLVKWVAMNLADAESKVTLLDVIDTPISPELIPAEEKDTIGQKTEDLVGPYELHDFFLYYTLRYGFRPSRIFFLAQQAFSGKDSRVEKYSDDVIKHWMSVFFKRFFAQQFKRNCLPEGAKVGSLSLSPRGDWSMPGDAISRAWMEECETL